MFYPKKRPPKKRYVEKNVYGAVAAPSRVAATKAKAMAEVGVTAEEVTLTPFLDDRVALAPAPAPAAAATAAAPVAAKAAAGAAAAAVASSPPAKRADHSAAADDKGGEPHGGSPQPHFHTHAGPFPVTHALHGLSALVAEKVRPERGRAEREGENDKAPHSFAPLMDNLLRSPHRYGYGDRCGGSPSRASPSATCWRPWVRLPAPAPSLAPAPALPLPTPAPACAPAPTHAPAPAPAPAPAHTHY